MCRTSETPRRLELSRPHPLSSLHECRSLASLMRGPSRRISTLQACFCFLSTPGARISSLRLSIYKEVQIHGELSRGHSHIATGRGRCMAANSRGHINSFQLAAATASSHLLTGLLWHSLLYTPVGPSENLDACASFPRLETKCSAIGGCTEVRPKTDRCVSATA